MGASLPEWLTSSTSRVIAAWGFTIGRRGLGSALSPPSCHTLILARPCTPPHAAVWLSRHPHVYAHLGHHLRTAPPWCYLGGLLGVTVVAAGAFIPQRLTFSSYFVCTVSGQLAASMLFDRWGPHASSYLGVWAPRASPPAVKANAVFVGRNKCY